MVLSALSFLTTELNEYLTTALQLLEPKALLLAPVNLDGSPATDLLDKVIVTLLNLEPEVTVRNLTPGQAHMGELRPNSALKLNLRVLFAAHFSDYAESLKFLELILAFFQEHNLFTSHSAPQLAKGIDLVVELESTTYQEWGFLWGMMGTKAMPGAIYKVRMMTTQNNVVPGTARIVTELGVTS